MKISIIIPVYYNSTSLPSLAGRLNELASRLSGHIFEFIYVDDGSGDDSFSIIHNLAQADQRIRAVRLVRNFGSNAAILAGLSQASGDCAAFVAAATGERDEQGSDEEDGGAAAGHQPRPLLEAQQSVQLQTSRH